MAANGSLRSDVRRNWQRQRMRIGAERLHIMRGCRVYCTMESLWSQ